MKSLKKIVSVFLVCLMALSVMSVSAFAADEVITNVDITVASPANGEKASGACVIDTLNTALNFIEWGNAATDEILYSSDSSTAVVDKAFENGNSYTVRIIIKTGEGYVFNSAKNLNVTINGNKAEIADISPDGKTLAVTSTFTCGAEGEDNGSDTFGQILNFLKTLLLTFVRIIGAFFGIK